MGWVIIHMPANPGEPFNLRMRRGVEVVFGNGVRMVAASMLAFWAGDFANSFVLARMKVLTHGRMLWTRTIGSTVVGQAVDSAIFYPVAFLGIWTAQTVGSVIVFNWLFQVAVEAALTPGPGEGDAGLARPAAVGAPAGAGGCARRHLHGEGAEEVVEQGREG